MLFDDKLLFIHAPKTAGMAVTKFLIENAPDGVTLTVPPGHAETSPKVTVIAGTRHERLPEAVDVLAKFGRKLDGFDTIISVMRNPYDLEVSYYHYKRLGHAWDAGKAQRLALTGDFVQFARNAPYYGRLPAHIEDWYQIDGKMPENLRIVRFENIEADLYDLVGRLYPIVRKIEKVNVTTHEPYASFLSPEAEDAIYRKYRWIFDNKFYPREAAAPTNRKSVYLQLSDENAAAQPQSDVSTDKILKRLQAYRDDGYAKLRGGMAPIMFDVLAAASQVQGQCGIVGAVYEIGVAEGRFFLALDQLRRQDEAAVAIDVFDDGEGNADGSEVWDTQSFLANVGRYSLDANSVKAVKADSLTISSKDILTLLRKFGRAKLFSLDGGRSAEHTMNDLLIAEQIVANGGLVFLGDYSNILNPGVTEAFARYMMFRCPKLSPILFAGNKLVLTNIAYRTRMLMLIREHLSRAKKNVVRRSMFGVDILVIR